MLQIDNGENSYYAEINPQIVGLMFFLDFPEMAIEFNLDRATVMPGLFRRVIRITVTNDEAEPALHTDVSLPDHLTESDVYCASLANGISNVFGPEFDIGDYDRVANGGSIVAYLRDELRVHSPAGPPPVAVGTVDTIVDAIDVPTEATPVRLPSRLLPPELCELIAQFMPTPHWETLEREFRYILTCGPTVPWDGCTVGDEGPIYRMLLCNGNVEIGMNLDRNRLAVPGSFRRCLSMEIWDDQFTGKHIKLAPVDHDLNLDVYVGSLCQLVTRAMPNAFDVGDYSGTHMQCPSRDFVAQTLAMVPIQLCTKGINPNPQPLPSSPRYRRLAARIQLVDDRNESIGVQLIKTQTRLRDVLTATGYGDDGEELHNELERVNSEFRQRIANLEAENARLFDQNVHRQNDLCVANESLAMFLGREGVQEAALKQRIERLEGDKEYLEGEVKCLSEGVFTYIRKKYGLHPRYNPTNTDAERIQRILNILKGEDLISRRGGNKILVFCNTQAMERGKDLIRRAMLPEVRD
jgi:hypothetical protein